MMRRPFISSEKNEAIPYFFKKNEAPHPFLRDRCFFFKEIMRRLIFFEQNNAALVFFEEIITRCLGLLP
jgi:hypothetical protein